MTRRPRDMDGAEVAALSAIVATLVANLLREITGLATIATIGGYDLNIADPAFALAVLAAIASWYARPVSLNAATAPALLLAALFCLSLVRGVADNAFMALFWFRAAGFLAPFVVIGATLRPGAAFCHRARTVILAAGVVLVGVVILRTLFGAGLFFVRDFDSTLAINDDGRAISNLGAIVVVMGIVLTVGAMLGRGTAGPFDGILAAFLATGLILSQQATAFLAAMAALVALVMVERPFREGALIGLGAVVLSTLVYAGASAWIEALPPEWRQTLAHRGDNLGTREAVWQSFWARYATEPIGDKLIGTPAGQDQGLIVFISGEWHDWRASVHNMYVGLVSTEGLLGLSAYLAMIAGIVAIALSLARTPFRLGGFTPAIAVSLVVVALVEGYSYELQQERLILLLVPLLVVAQARRIATSAASPWTEAVSSIGGEQPVPPA